MTWPASTDERPHGPGPEPDWTEAWTFDFFVADGSVGGSVTVARHPNRSGGRFWYWASLVGAGRPLVAVADHGVPPPRRPWSLELRSDGLWADHNCETAGEHWSIGLEAFGVRLDDPSECYGEPRGDRVGIAFDLEWETDGHAVTGSAGPGEQAGTTRYEIPCRVHGEVLVEDEVIEIDGWGQRDHLWGPQDWWGRPWCRAAGRLDDGTRWHSFELDGAAARIAGLDASGLPVGGRLLRTDDGAAGVELVVEPLAWAPVRTEGGDGRACLHPRGLVAVRTPTGTGGVGWWASNHPEGV